MIPNPHFEQWHPTPDHGDPELPHDAVNDAIFGKETKPLEAQTNEELFRLRKAHEINLKLGYRDSEIDERALQEIHLFLAKRGVSEEMYKAFLTDLRESV